MGQSDSDGPEEGQADMGNCDMEFVNNDVWSDISDGDLLIAKTRDRHTPTDIAGRAESKTYAPNPAIRQSKPANAGFHSNPFNLPKSAFNAVSIHMVSQVLTNLALWVVFFFCRV